MLEGEEPEAVKDPRCNTDLSAGPEGMLFHSPAFLGPVTNMFDI